ncbi:hemolysin family protein [Sanguibacter sp. 25GB23B1]|uniref:hemolysin family protein n=1 Tax=unclassified Sanguibacter TaxID=2645534 RepID=UPI0032AFE05D
MSNPWIIISVTVLLIALSAFFVAIEFALLAAKRHRLEDAASHSRAARAALRSASELTLLLAGSQLGITICTLALGAVTKPAVHHWLTPLFESWGIAALLADVAGFALALIIVTFLHLVVGEMAPKSWAIAHPERSATLLAIPMRAFMALTRPLLRALNESANWCLRRVGVEPADQVASGQNPDDLRHLLEHSANVGALDPAYFAQLSGALELQSLTIADLVDHDARPVFVDADGTMDDIRAATLATGHLRLLVGDPDAILGVVHVRDTLAEPDDRAAREVVRPVFTLDAATPVYAALTAMRETRNHLAVITHGDELRGVVTLADVLRRLFPRTSAQEAIAQTT